MTFNITITISTGPASPLGIKKTHKHSGMPKRTQNGPQGMMMTRRGGLCVKSLIDCHHPPEGAIKLPLPWGQIRFGVLYVGEWGTWGKEGL